MKPSIGYVLLFGLALGAWSSASRAYVGAPQLSPANPSSVTPISIHIPAGGCHAFVDMTDEAELIVVAPGQLRVVVDGIAMPPGHPFCIYPDYTYRFDIGTLAAGSYDLEFVLRDDESFSNPIVLALGNISLDVAEPASVPLGLFGGLMLASLVLASGRRSLRRS